MNDEWCDMSYMQCGNLRWCEDACIGWFVNLGNNGTVIISMEHFELRHHDIN